MVRLQASNSFGVVPLTRNGAFEVDAFSCVSGVSEIRY